MFSEVADSDQDSLVAQLVLTLGNRPGVGQVLFTRDGEPFLVRVPSRGNILSSSPVAADDFESLLLDAVNPPPTSTATSIAETLAGHDDADRPPRGTRDDDDDHDPATRTHDDHRRRQRRGAESG